MRRVIMGVLLASCGARTGLWAPEPHDAATLDVFVADAALDAVTDVRVDVPPDAPPFNGAVRIAASRTGTCVVSATSGASCWGLSASNATASSTPQPVVGITNDVVALGMSTGGACAVTSTGNAFCWGANIYGQLGNGSVVSSLVAVPVTGITSAASVVGGGNYANCILMGSGAVECMGGDYVGNLVLGTITSTSYTTPQTSKVTGAIKLAGSGVNGSVANCAIVSGGHVECWGFMQYSLGDGFTAAAGVPLVVAGVTGAVEIATSGSNICIVLADGTMKCWGENLWGEVGDGTTSNRTTPVSTTMTGVASVSIGGGHTCVVTTTGAVDCVGWNTSGQLGDGTVTSTATWEQAIVTGAVGVACGGAHTCALLATGKVLCWGDNSFGQLGDGTNVPRYVPTPVLL